MDYISICLCEMFRDFFLKWILPTLEQMFCIEHIDMLKLVLLSILLKSPQSFLTSQEQFFSGGFTAF